MSAPRARSIELDVGGDGHSPILEGPPETASMRSGMVALRPGEAVGAHSTGDFEEVLITLEGRGELRSHGQAPLPIAPSRLAYCPPHTEHDVVNTGRTRLRYIYVVAMAPDPAEERRGE